MGYLEELSAKGQKANPFFVMMGIEPISFGDGAAVLSMQVRPDMLNGDGWLQGGVYTALVDEAMALALITVLGEGERIATISEATSFLSGVQDGMICASGRVIRKGRSVAFAEGEVTRDDGRVLARTTASFAVLQPGR
ncbi:PaaI family thioesterase [Methanofollis tationis]|uniref:PaaI family thioesterase n=1 Tax=Methanofollis tationis TaxID=81417 RepID=A0A7K4HQY5_9EURY|nr:PaaI family thioesterase [Methanofollis tationis]NVO67582.1 PaaI family thioesterase [Methanofollis tationis]